MQSDTWSEDTSRSPIFAVKSTCCDIAHYDAERCRYFGAVLSLALKPASRENGSSPNVSDKEFSQYQEPAQNGDQAVDANGAMRCRPRKHQDPIKRHEFLRPDHASQAEDKIRLNNKTKNQIKIHSVHKVFPAGESKFYYMAGVTWNGKIAIFGVSKVAERVRDKGSLNFKHSPARLLTFATASPSSESLCPSRESPLVAHVEPCVKRRLSNAQAREHL